MCIRDRQGRGLSAISARRKRRNTRRPDWFGSAQARMCFGGRDELLSESDEAWCHGGVTERGGRREARQRPGYAQPFESKQRECRGTDGLGIRVVLMGPQARVQLR